MKVKNILLITATAFVIFACASSPPAGARSMKEEPKEPPVFTIQKEQVVSNIPGWNVVDYKTEVLSAEAPKWVTQSPEVLEKERLFREYHLFITQTEGISLERAKAKGRHFDLLNQIINRFSLWREYSIIEEWDEKEAVQRRIEQASTDITITGIKRVDDFWIKLENTDGEVRFIYFSLHTVPRKEIKGLMEEVKRLK